MDYIVKALQQHQELASFVSLAAGFLIGRIKIGSFSLGTVVGTLLAGVIIGQLDIKVPATVKSVFFDLFLFTTGIYRALCHRQHPADGMGTGDCGDDGIRLRLSFLSVQRGL